MIIRRDAAKFRNELEYEHKPGYAEKVKHDLQLHLLNYDEGVDKLIYLYGVMEQIDDLYSKHLSTCKFKDNPPGECDQNWYYVKMKMYTEQEIRRLNPEHEFTILRPRLNSTLIKQNLVSLETHPAVAKLYLSALDKINSKVFERNLLDDLRLTVEILLKEILNNNAPLEGQKVDLAKYLDSRGVSKHLINMYVALHTYFSNYQNDYVKHNDNVNRQEIEVMINLTSTFVNFMLHV